MRRPPVSMLVAWAFLILTLASTKEGFTSGGGEINVTRAEVRLSMATPRKRPMPGDEAKYGQAVAAWEKANQAGAEKIVKAIEDVLPRYRPKLTLLANSFDVPSFRELDAEGVSDGGGYDDAPWRLTVELELEDNIATNVRFVFKTRPTKALVRAFSRDVQAAALRTVGKTLAPLGTYTGYWLTAADGATSLLLTTVPLAKLTPTLQAASWRPMSFVAFRRAPSLVITTAANITANDAGFLLANPTAATFERGKTSVVLQVNGSDWPAMKITKAARADVAALIKYADATAEERTRRGNDVEFLSTLKLAP